MKTIEMILLTQLTNTSDQGELSYDEKKLALSRKALLVELKEDYQFFHENEIDLAGDYQETITYLESISDEAYQVLRDKLVRFGSVSDD
ncbi:hypothetical protein [Streptococcus agalactiae]|uniref:hypothetical protein n=1 Tax=Streptococcus agalactiae TaxID=1311 RepID=UPI001303EC75|nr:hypothetical protein [Streptococcus agalactiae]KAF0052065.1 hypothetical protein GL192_00865 [Streptococcus agalactiae]